MGAMTARRMSREHEAHLGRVKRRIVERIDAKYRAGQRQHGGRLWEKPVLEELLDEIADLAVYAETLREKLRGNP